MTYDILAIGPHPDDIELSCGGTIITMADNNYRVGIVDLTDANLSTRGNVEQRRQEADEAAKIMGVSKRFRLSLSEGALTPTPDNLKPLIKVIRQARPQIVLCPYWDDRHPDHVDASRLVQSACFWAGIAKYEVNGTDDQILAPHRPHRVLYYFLHWEGPTSLVVDISSAFDRKLQTIRAFHSQFFARPSQDPVTYISRPEFLEKVINRARHFGSQIGTEYGEPFHVRETNQINDIVAWADSQGIVG